MLFHVKRYCSCIKYTKNTIKHTKLACERNLISDALTIYALLSGH